MKKSDAVEILREILQEWDGCLIDKKAARQILNKIQKDIGMVPPSNRRCFCHDCACLPDHSWEPARHK